MFYLVFFVILLRTSTSENAYLNLSLLAAVTILSILKPENFRIISIAILGAVPYGTSGFFGVRIPYLTIFGLIGLLLLASDFFLRGFVPKIKFIDGVLALYVAVSLLTVFATQRSATDWNEYIKWFLVLSFIFYIGSSMHSGSLLHIKPFVLGVSLGGFFTLLNYLYLIPSSSMNSILASFGYLVSPKSEKYFIFQGQNLSQRASGLYTEPNICASFMIVGLLLSIYLAKEVSRLFYASLIICGSLLLLSYSRGAIFSLLLALLVVSLTLGKVNLKIFLLLLSSSAISIILIPNLRIRLFTSFSESDTGYQDRVRTYSEKIGELFRYWEFGKGWGLAEFRNSYDAYWNLVPPNYFLAIWYRGGLIVASIGLGIMVFGLIASLVSIRKRSKSVYLHIPFIALCFQAQSGHALGIQVQPISLFYFCLYLALSGSNTITNAKNQNLSGL